MKVEKEEEENIALTKVKAKKGPCQGQNSKGGEKKDLSKVTCFGSGEFGYYITQCPKKRKEKKGQVQTTCNIPNRNKQQYKAHKQETTTTRKTSYEQDKIWRTLSHFIKY